MNVLVVAAHPDDEVLGCGATMARHTLEGDEVHVVILGEGATSRATSSAESSRDVAALALAAQAAGSELGVASVTVHNLPDNRFDSLALLDVVKVVETHVANRTPDVVYTHHPGDLNIDHALAARAVLTATRPQPAHSVRALYAFEIFSSTEWAFGALAPPWVPNHFVDISDTLDRKLVALSCYATEMRDFPHPRSIEAIRAGAARSGSAVGVHAAEAFAVLRSIR